jgi:hypothetical protein
MYWAVSETTALTKQLGGQEELMIRWLAVAGMGIALLGSFVMVGDHLFLSWRTFMGWLGGFTAAETALREISRLNQQDVNGNQYGFVRKGDDGFNKLLAVIASHRQEYRSKNVLAIVCTKAFDYNVGEGSVPSLFVSLRTDESTVPNAVASQVQVEGWLSDARTRFVFFIGFFALLMGFALSVPATVCQALQKPPAT